MELVVAVELAELEQMELDQQVEPEVQLLSLIHI